MFHARSVGLVTKDIQTPLLTPKLTKKMILKIKCGKCGDECDFSSELKCDKCGFFVRKNLHKVDKRPFNRNRLRKLLEKAIEKLIFMHK